MSKSILFISIENRGRTQIAEGLARHFLGHQSDVSSAGLRAAERMHPMAVAVMAEIGTDISDQEPKNVESVSLDHYDTVFLITDAETGEAPFAKLIENLKKGTKYEFWSLSNPAEATDVLPEDQMRKFRKVRDDIRKRVLSLRAADQVW